MKAFLSLTLALCLTISGVAQLTGKQRYDNLGLAFTIPSGWFGQEGDGSIILGHETIPGIVVVTTHTARSMEEMEKEASRGIVDQNGTQLRPSGPIQYLDAKTLAVICEGTLEWSPAKAYIAGVVNPGGTGLLVMTITSPEAYSADHPQVTKQILESAEFFKAVVPDAVGEWQQLLQNARLTYMESYNSGGGYGGYSNKEVIDLCAAGYFQYSSNYNMSIDTGGAYGYDSDNGNGAGGWKIISNAQGQPVLQLNFHSGEVSEYVITYDGSATYLNGYRYYRTYGTTADDGPNCN